MITAETLRDLNACKSGIDEFHQVFPNGTEVTKESIQTALKAELDVKWLIISRPNLFVGFRDSFLASPRCASLYARYIDKAPRDDTRAAACQHPKWAYLYANNVDKAPRPDTRAAACRDPQWAYLYALYIDKAPRPDTRAAACGDPYWAHLYEHLRARKLCKGNGRNPAGSTRSGKTPELGT